VPFHFSAVKAEKCMSHMAGPNSGSTPGDHYESQVGTQSATALSRIIM